MALTRDEIKRLRGEAHGLAPVVRIGDNGLTDGVHGAIDDALEAHELIKVRMLTDDRDQRADWQDEILARHRAEKVQSIGKMLVMWRKRRPKKERNP